MEWIIGLCSRDSHGEVGCCESYSVLYCMMFATSSGKSGWMKCHLSVNVYMLADGIYEWSSCASLMGTIVSSVE